MIVVDGGVGDLHTLLAGVRPGLAVFVLDRHRDGVGQIAAICEGHGLRDIAALHIVAHGEPGAIRLGSASLSSANLHEAASSLSTIGAALAPTGEILLYGCAVGRGAAGAKFIAALADLTGADVAAASHIIGGASPQSWELDARAVPAVAMAPFSTQALRAYQPTLTITGQLWYTILDVPGSPGNLRRVGGFFNSDGTSFTQEGGQLTGTTTAPTTAWSMAVDTAAGLMFVVNTDDVSISVYNIKTNALIETLQVGDLNGPGSPDDDLVNAIAVDPINHTLFVNRWGETLAETGIVKISYDPITGDLNNNGAFNSGAQQFLINSSQPNGSGKITNATTFEIDVATHKLYYTDWDNNYSFSPFSPTNAIYVVSDYTAANPTVTQLTTTGQFPTNGSNGYIGNIAVDDAKGLIYFTVSDFGDPPGQAHLYYMPINGGTATKIADIDNVNLGNSIAAGLSLDPVTQQLYVSLARYSSGTSAAPTANANKVLVYQLSADGHSFVGGSPIASYTLNQLEGQAPTDNNSHPGASVWNQLPVLVVTGTGTHAGEQGAAITLATSFTSSDADGGYYSGATVQITGGTFSSNESSTADDHLFVQDGGTQRISGLFTGTNITVTYDSATEKLSLSGYDTIAHYNTVMSALHYNTTGDNPTNYGLNTTRTLTWTVSDGSLNVTAGQGQNSGTTTITIDAVNDAPVIGTITNIGSQIINEDVLTGFTGISSSFITDPDANPASAPIIVALHVAHGTLTVTGSGPTIVGSGTDTVTLTGTQNQIDGILSAAGGLKYQGASNYNGADTLTVTVNDQGATGSGGAQQVSQQFNFTVTAVNDQVTASAPGTANLTEDSSVAVSGLSIADVDTVLAPNGLYSITLSASHGTLTLTTLSGLTFDAGDGAADATMTFHGTLADINTALATLSYAGVANYNGADGIVFSVTDSVGGVIATGTGGATTDSKTIAVTVSAVNDPVTASAPATATIAEDVSTAVTGLSINDVDAALAPNGIYSVSLGAGHGFLTLTTLAGLTFDTGDGTLDAAMAFHGTLADINAALASASYQSTANYNGSDTITLSVTDTFGGVVVAGTGAATSDSKSIAVTVTAVNDPVTSTVPAALTVTEDTPVAVSGLSIADPDVTLAPDGIYSVTLSGTNGTLTLTTLSGLTFDAGDGTSDATMTFHGTLADINAALATASYAPNANFNGAAAITLAVTDDVGGTVATGPAGSGTNDTHTVNFTVGAVDDPPVNTVPGAQSTSPSGVITFTGATAISVADADVDEASPNNTVQVTLAVSAGTLNLHIPNNVSIDAGADGSATVTFSGTLTDVNAALDGLAYTAPANGGAVTLTVTTSDQGHTGAGGPLTDIDTVSINVINPISIDLDGDNSSGATGTDYFAQYAGSPIAIADTDAVAADPAQITTATITISGNYQPGEDVLAFTDTANITTVSNTGGVLTLTSADATPAEWAAALASVTYNDTSGTPNTANRTIDVVISDATSSSQTAQTTVYFHTLDLDSGTAGFDATASFLEQTPVTIAPNGTISGFDNLTSLTVTLLARPDGDGVESLLLDAAAQTAASGASLAISYTAATGELSISGAAAQSVYQTILDGIQYTNTSDTPTTANRSVSVVIADATAGTSQAHTVTIDVTAVNDAPTITAPGTIGVTEDVASALTGISFADVDAGAGIETVTLGVASGALAAASGGGVTVGGTASALTLSGTIANINAFIAGSHVSYTTAANATSDVTLTVSIDDGGNTGADPGTSGTVTSEAASTTVTLNVAAVNDPPTITAPPTIGVTEDVASALTGISFADVDAGAGIVTATLGVGAGALAATSGSGVTVGGTASALTLSGTIADINAFIAGSNISYTTVANATGNVALNITIDDGGHTGIDPGTSGTATSEAASTSVTLNVTPVNDAPTALASSVATNEDTPKTFAASDFNFSDVNDSPSNALQSIIITSLAAHGTLMLGATAVQVNDQIAVAQLGSLVYTPNADYNGTDSFDFKVQDDGGLVGAGAADTSTNAATMTINIAAVNDAPVLDNVAVSAAYPPGSGPVTLAPALTISDVDSTTLSGATVRINSATTFLGDVLSVNGLTSGLVAGTNISVIYNPGNATLTLSGLDTRAHYEEVLRLITFQSTSATPTNGGANAARTVEWQVNDGAGLNNLSSVATTDIRLHTLDLDADDSTALGTSYATTFTEKAGNVFVAGDSALDITINDVDVTGGQKITSATVTLTNAKAGDFLSLISAPPNGITVVIDNTIPGQITLTLSGGSSTGAASIADYQAALHQIQFGNSSNTPDTTPREISVIVHDSLGIDTNAATSTVSVIAVNDAPIVNTGGASLNYIENQPATPIDASLQLSDPDSINFASARVAISANFHAGEDFLGFTNQNGIVGSYDAATGVLTLSGVASIATYQTALRSVTYVNPSESPSGDTRTISFTVDDGQAQNHLSNAGDVAVAVTPVNDSPVLSGVTAHAALPVGGAPFTLSSSLAISDLDNATLVAATIRVSDGFFAGDGNVLAVGAGGLTGTSISASYDAATETLTLSGTDTLAHYEQALEHVTFETTHTNPTNFGLDPSRTFEWQLDDGGASNNLSTIQTTVLDLPKSHGYDFNGDGHGDILWQNFDGTPAIWLMDGGALKAMGPPLPNPSPAWQAIDAADFNGDGKSDILWQSRDGTPAVWLMDGTGVVSYGPPLPNAGPSWHVKAADDFDGDGKADILWQNDSGNPAVWLMDGVNAQSIGPALSNLAGPSWRVIDAADFNGDGKADILWQNQSGPPAIWLMNGTNAIAIGAPLINPGPAWHAQLAADFDGDGKADILWQNNDGTAAVWLMDGTSLKTMGAPLPNLGVNWHVAEATDFNGDGLADILWQNSNGALAVSLMQGTTEITTIDVGVNPGSSWHAISPHHDLFF